MADSRKTVELIQSRANQVNAAPTITGSPFNPNSYITNPTDNADPSLAEPLPQGRYIDPTMPSDANSARMAQVTAFLNNPEKYMQDNTVPLNNEQSLIDKGKSMLSRVFDYQDDADAQIFGMNVSGVESVWDGFLRYFTGYYDLLNVGFGGLISAAPGGLRTLSYDELSGGKSVGEVLSGEMDHESAPSPGQIFVASVATESKRIREGGARLSDVLLLNPATAPFIAAGLAAGDSPLQKDGFDIMNKEQREAAFGSGWEKWMSGVTDFGLAFADPLIGGGVVTKVTRAGMLGTRGSARLASAVEGAIRAPGGALDEIAQAAGLPQGHFQMELDNLVTPASGFEGVASATPSVNQDVVRAIMRGEQPNASQLGVLSQIPVDAVKPDNFSPMASFLWDVSAVDKNGNKVMPFEEIINRPEIADSAFPSELADMLHSTSNPALAGLIIADASGSTAARQTIMKVAPATADILEAMSRERIAALNVMEPAKVKDATDMLERMKQNLMDSRSTYDSLLGKVDPFKDPDRYTALTTRRSTIDASIEQADELIDSVKNGNRIDPLNPDSAFYRADVADQIMADLHSQLDPVTKALNQELQTTGAFVSSKSQIITKNNAYARAVGRSRTRRQKARYQFAIEGTAIFPKNTAEGKTGWFESSSFNGVGRFRRNARVWRYVGQGTPSGYLGLKGANTVGSEKELAAIFDLKLLKGNGVKVTREVMGENGIKKPVTEIVGGTQRRDEFMRRFAAALNTPTKDPLDEWMKIEFDLMDDYAKVYGIYGQDGEVMRGLLRRANKSRENNLQLIRNRGYFIDPDTGTRHYSPFLDSQLANGTYTQNFQALEKILEREVRKDGGARLRQFTGTVTDIGGQGYDLFNDFWRPLTLMRLSYTQRNVFEGMVRAMAYQASLAPLLWPVKATSIGIRDKAVARAVSKRTKIATEALSDSDYMALQRELDSAVADELRIQQAVRFDGSAEMKPGVYMQTGRDASNNPVYEFVDDAKYDQMLEQAAAKRLEVEGRLAADVGKYDEAIKGTKYGKWREKELADIQNHIDEMEARRAQIEDLLGETDANGMTIDLQVNNLGGKLAEMDRLMSVAHAQRNKLLYDPTAGIAMYRSKAGRSRRIGSGTSIGPDGNYYNDAFAGPYEQLARGNLSADNTVKQSLALHADALTSIWRQLSLKQNVPVPYSNIPAEQAKWVAGMRSVIETNSSSDLVAAMVERDWDVDRVLEWMLTDEKGRRWYQEYMTTQGSSEFHIQTIADAAGPESRRVGSAPYVSAMDDRPLVLKREGKTVEAKAGDVRIVAPKDSKRPARLGDSVTPTRGRQAEAVLDPDMARAIIAEHRDMVLRQMQNQPVFIDLLKARTIAKQTGGQFALDDQTVKVALDSLSPEDQARLGFVQGSEMIEMGTPKFKEMWAKLTGKVFKYLGTIPEDAVVRGPFYNERFKAMRNSLIAEYLDSTGQGGRLQGKFAKGSTGARQVGTMQHESFKIPASELARIEVMSHRRALLDTKEWLYTIDRRTKLGKYGEWIYPFISATQNSTTVIGKLLYKEPWLGPMIIDLWRAPTRLGWEDENGMIHLPMPMPWVRDFLKNHPEIPFLGGAIDSHDELMIPKNGLNVWIPESGFGVLPTPTPWVQVGASEMMKANIFPTETPQIFKTIVGNDEEADRAYGLLKDYIFGENMGPSERTMSWDKLFPSWSQKIIYSKQELSAEYGYQYMLQWNTQLMRYRAGERDTPPDENEINQRTTNMFWFQFFGNQGVPTPLTPGPTLTRTIVESPVQIAVEWAKKYRENFKDDPGQAAMLFDQQFGDWMTEISNTKITSDVGGANPTPETVSDIKTFESLLRNASQVAGSNLDVLGIIINNRGAASNYDQSSYDVLKATTIPGTNQQFKEVLSGEQSLMERQRTAGWLEYRKFMDQLDARLQAAGLPNYNVAAAAPFKNARDQFIRNMSINQDYRGWYIDFSERSAPRAQSAVRVLEMAVEDPTFQQEMYNSGKEGLLGTMQAYVTYRRSLIQALHNSGHGLTHEDNLDLKMSWDTIRQKWKEQDVRWAEIANLYLSGDDDPQFVGSFTESPLPIAYGVKPNG